MIAAVLASHEHHEAAVRAFESRLRKGDRLAIIGHTLIEAFAVLTRSPGPYMLGAAESWTLLKLSFVDQAERVLSLTGEEYVNVVKSFPAELSVGNRCSYR